MPKTKHICQWCEDEFLAYPYYNRKYCSRDCTNKALSKERKGKYTKKVRTTCANCGKEIWVYKIRLAERNYCDHKCQIEYMRGTPRMHTRNRIKVKCANCGIKIEKTPSAVKRSNLHFCQQNCYFEYQRAHPERNYKYKGGKVRVKCQNCGIFIYKRPCDLERNQKLFCGKECHDDWQRKHPRTGKKHHQWRRIPVTCEICGKVTYKWPSHVAKYKYQFCSNECRHRWLSESNRFAGENNPAWRGGYGHYYGPNWNRQRDRARKRDNYHCQHCGILEKKLGYELHVHHLIAFREFGYVPDKNQAYKQANRLQNLISLCQPCHLRAEHKSIPIQAKLL